MGGQKKKMPVYLLAGVIFLALGTVIFIVSFGGGFDSSPEENTSSSAGQNSIQKENRPSNPSKSLDKSSNLENGVVLSLNKPASSIGETPANRESDTSISTPSLRTPADTQSSNAALLKSNTLNNTGVGQTKKVQNHGVHSGNLPKCLLLPVASTKMIKTRDLKMLCRGDLDTLEFINKKRQEAGLKDLPTLPTGLDNQECLQLLNARLLSKGQKPLARMPMGCKVQESSTKK